jgi:squalene-hopene/tetraprenyl-beta-curcumene cyclase
VNDRSLAPLERTLLNLREELLRRRTPAGVWEGRLASSALSTATAVIALDSAARAEHAGLVRAGRAWLAANQNKDGGFGDTVLSFSNLSTTALAWAALAMSPDAAAPVASAADRGAAWLKAQLGSLDARTLCAAIVGRYGRDRTFSVPILTALTLAGRLGPAAAAFRVLPQLPFELAALPHRFWQHVRLPVVSYALPALIALGRVRHENAPTRNPLLRRLRAAALPRAMATLRQMQPASGGYLEATPLTSFVVMSLAACGDASHPVAGDGLRFLAGSARPDGSWPIDTNLATWVTTLAVGALGPDAFPSGDAAPIADWLLAQQWRHEHPFTHAPAGGWAWTDLTGGVPDGDDTSGALLALALLARGEAHARAAAAAGAGFLLRLQNRDGGIPTFCRGWGTLPFDRSSPDLTAHALLGWSAWHPDLPSPLQERVASACRRAVAYLLANQQPDGSWLPLWFGNQHVPGESNATFGTSRVVTALGAELARRSSAASQARRRGAHYLMKTQNPDGGWGGGPGAPSSLEETGLALRALAAAELDDQGTLVAALGRGARYIVESTDEGRQLRAAPIGLYFARLWYFEELYPLVFALCGLRAACERLAASR